ncbi:hypothetical protein D3C74_417550 [compost metagenome]
MSSMYFRYDYTFQRTSYRQIVEPMLLPAQLFHPVATYSNQSLADLTVSHIPAIPQGTV